MTSIKTQVSLHGRRAGVTKDDQLAALGGFVAGGNGKTSIVLPGAPDTVAIFDDFLGDILSDPWNAVEGTDTGSHATQAITAATNGVLRLLSGTGYADYAGPGSGLTQELNWKANMGRLRMSCRVKIPTITTVSVFIGFTDTKSLEAPLYEDTGTGVLVSDATDAVGWLYDTANSKTTWQLVGVANDTDATAQDTSVTPTANVYEELEVFVNSDGSADFFRNGAPAGSRMTGAVTATVAMTPVAIVWPRVNNAARQFDIDYLNISAARDTGT